MIMKSMLLLLLTVVLMGSTCTSYVQEVRRDHYAIFGVNYPYQYGVAQLQQESGCRNILSNDGVGSEGLPQITYRVWQKPLKDAGIVDIKSVGNQLHAQAIIMHSLHRSSYPLWQTYQIYNGGGLVTKEITRAGSTDWQKAKDQCKRGQSCFTSRGVKTCKSNCDINYDYSKKIDKYSKEYSNVQSNQFRFW